jgi:hypothetical protein
MTITKTVYLISFFLTSMIGFSQITGNTTYAMDSINWEKPTDYTIAGIQIEKSEGGT